MLVQGIIISKSKKQEIKKSDGISTQSDVAKGFNLGL